METARPAEALNFFWHCRVAVKLIDELQDTTVTKAHALHAVRMATLCAAGRNGVQYASEGARMIKGDQTKHWEKFGLVKEHAIPVRLVRTLVLNDLRATSDGAQAAVPLVLSEQDMQGLTPKVIALFRQHPRAWQAARIIREWTLLAWITKDEDARFDDKARHGGISLRDRMPTGWTHDQDRFARYNSCGIVVSPISAPASNPPPHPPHATPTTPRLP